MQLKYGSYAFNADDVSISHSRKTMRSDTGFRTGYMDNWVIDFRLRADTQAELTTEINLLYSAFGRDGFDLVLLDNTGANSAFITRNNQTTSGVRIQNVDFPNLKNAQYTTFIDGVIWADAETITNISVDLVYTDSFVVTGNGGPMRVVLETATSSPIVQTTRQKTKVTAIQSGQAQAIGAIPNKPIMMFPQLLKNEAEKNGLTSSVENNTQKWTRTWSYPYQSNQFFSGIPQVRL